MESQEIFQDLFNVAISLRSKRSCAFLGKRKPRIGERTSFGRAKIGESAKNEARERGQNPFGRRSWVFLSLKTHRNACYAGYVAIVLVIKPF